MKEYQPLNIFPVA